MYVPVSFVKETDVNGCLHCFYVSNEIVLDTKYNAVGNKSSKASSNNSITSNNGQIITYNAMYYWSDDLTNHSFISHFYRNKKIPIYIRETLHYQSWHVCPNIIWGIFRSNFILAKCDQNLPRKNENRWANNIPSNKHDSSPPKINPTKLNPIGSKCLWRKRIESII